MRSDIFGPPDPGHTSGEKSKIPDQFMTRRTCNTATSARDGSKPLVAAVGALDVCFGSTAQDDVGVCMSQQECERIK